jgi:DNA-repair protein XRCC3
VKTLDDPDGLWNVLASVAAVLRDPPGGALRPVRLIVVDSISSPFRETDATQHGGLADRTGMLSRMAVGGLPLFRAHGSGIRV